MWSCNVERATTRHDNALVQLLGLGLYGFAAMRIALALLFEVRSQGPAPPVARGCVWQRRTPALEWIFLREGTGDIIAVPCFWVGCWVPCGSVALLRVRRAAGRSSTSGSGARLCLAGTARDGVFARVAGADPSCSSVAWRVVRRKGRRVVGAGSVNSVSSSVSSVVAVLAELDGTSTMPRVEGFVRACALCTWAAWGRTWSMKRPTSAGFFEDEG